jgi:hypothetical protein
VLIFLETSSKASTKLRLEEFDDLIFEPRTPNEWVALGPQTTGAATRAVSRYHNVVTAQTSWQPCVVLAFDAARNAFLIEWSGSGKQKYQKKKNK